MRKERQDDVEKGGSVHDEEESDQNGESVPQSERPRRMGRAIPPVEQTKERRPVKDRWFYEVAGAALTMQTQSQCLGERVLNDDVGGKDQTCDFGPTSFGKTIQNPTNSVIPDQSKRFPGEENLLSTSSEFPDLTSDVKMKTSLVNKFKEKL